MLETVLDVYLASLSNERAFDAPFLALLPAMAYFDVHYTHGGGEFGKDFIAKKHDGAEVIQYSFQLKRDIAQSEWREVQSQILEAAISPLTHPHFDGALPHQPVLVATGRISNNAAINGANLNQKLQLLGTRVLEVWERPQLVTLLTAFGLNGVHQATSSGFRAFGRFYSLYGEALEGKISPRDIEKYSRNWLHVPVTEMWPPTPEALAAAPSPSPESTKSRLLAAALESAILSGRCFSSDLRYEALICNLAAWRAILHAWHGASERGDLDLVTHCQNLHARVRERVLDASQNFINWVEDGWPASDRQLVMRVADIGGSVAQILSYPMHCARIVETLGFLFFLHQEPNRREAIAALLAEFLEQEPGCTRPIGDHYAVSYVWPLLALGMSGRRDIALKWWRELSLWLFDRFEQGRGLARLESTPLQEATALFGSAFVFIETQSTSGSFLATVLADIVVWLDDHQGYEDFVSDLEPLRILPQYVQPPDSEGLFRFDAPDVNRLSGVTYETMFSAFTNRDFASHVRLDRTSYNLSGELDLSAFAALSILLRDRAFPGMCPLRG